MSSISIVPTPLDALYRMPRERLRVLTLELVAPTVIARPELQPLPDFCLPEPGFATVPSKLPPNTSRSVATPSCAADESDDDGAVGPSGRNGSSRRRGPLTGTGTDRPTSPWCDAYEAAELLSCGRTRIFELIRTSQLRKVRGAPGRRTCVTRASVLAYRDGLDPGPAPVRRPGRKVVTAAPAVPDRATLAEELRGQRRKLFR